MKTFQNYIKLLETADNSVTDVFNMIASKFPQEAADFLNRYSSLTGINAPEGGFKSDDFSKEKRDKKIVTKGLGDVSMDDAHADHDVVAANHADSFQ